ncbi:MAG: ABC transporter permease [Ruminococcaceae bacterium]|nr:ABC transporter permease [Oscillospiraceae bacterium]
MANHLDQLVIDIVRIQRGVGASLIQQLLQTGNNNRIHKMNVFCSDTGGFYLDQRLQDLQTTGGNVAAIVHFFDFFGIGRFFLREKLVILGNDGSQVAAVLTEKEITEDVGLMKNRFTEGLPNGEELIGRTGNHRAEIRQLAAIFMKVFQGGKQDQLIGIPIGVLMAAKRNMLIDRSVNILAMVFAAIPSFAMALGMIYIFAVKLEWFPPYGAKTWKHYILPMATLILPSSVGRMRLARTTMLEAIRQEYITMARSKGIPENRVIFVHALKNSLIPLITSILTSFSSMLGGAIILENVFGFPGLGAYIINGINTKDAPTVLASTTFLAAIFCLTSLVLDIIYALVDPRVKERYKTVGK